MILDAVLRDAGARQRIFGGEKGRREVIIALRDEHPQSRILAQRLSDIGRDVQIAIAVAARSEEHTSELQSLMRISYAVFCLKKKKKKKQKTTIQEPRIKHHN